MPARPAGRAAGGEGLIAAWTVAAVLCVAVWAVWIYVGVTLYRGL
jgi:hypothetical protein